MKAMEATTNRCSEAQLGDATSIAASIKTRCDHEEQSSPSFQSASDTTRPRAEHWQRRFCLDAKPLFA